MLMFITVMFYVLTYFFKMKFLIVMGLMLYLCGRIRTDNCCPPGEAVIEGSERPMCWDPISNATSNLPLKCNLTQIAYGLDHEVTEAGNLHVYLQDLYLDEISNELYCIANTTTIEDVNLSNVSPEVVMCFDFPAERTIDEEILGYCMIVSAIFFFIITVIYLGLPELRDLQGKIIINLCFSFTVGLTILAIMKLAEYEDMTLCALRGFFTYFFLLAAFFWMNALAIQFLLCIRRPTVANYGWREFIKYAVYAWGCPTILTVVAVGVNYKKGRHAKPGIGLNHCWFISKTQQWIYLYSLMTVLIVANIAIFAYTSYTLWRQSFSSSHVKALRYKFSMTFRLFVLMGLPWIFEMIASVSPRHFIWELLDLFNALQGALCFVVLVVTRKKALKALYKRDFIRCAAVERHLAATDDEECVVQHTDVPLNDTIVK